jgi:hypothetical protein
VIWLVPRSGHRLALGLELADSLPLDLEAVMTRSISARTACCVLTAFFLTALAGCGGSGSARPDGPVLTGGSAGAGGSIVANGGGSSGGTAGTGSGGVSATGGCSGAPVTFQVMPAPNGVTHWCLGHPTRRNGSSEHECWLSAANVQRRGSLFRMITAQRAVRKIERFSHAFLVVARSF